LARFERKICRCPASWPRNPIWVNTKARPAATASCHHESPTMTNTVQAMASSPPVMAIFAQ
jgi:hypothetical protein